MTEMDQEVIYTVIVGHGYVEECRPARLILNYVTDKPDLTAKQIAKDLFDLLAEFVKQDIPEPNKCCKRAKKSDNFCSKCGQRIAGEDEQTIECVDRVQDLFYVIMTGTNDSIAGHSRSYTYLYEFMYERGWEQHGTLTSGPVVEITAFDRYIEDPDNRATEFNSAKLVVEPLETVE